MYWSALADCYMEGNVDDIPVSFNLRRLRGVVGLDASHTRSRFTGVLGGQGLCGRLSSESLMTMAALILSRHGVPGIVCATRLAVFAVVMDGENIGLDSAIAFRNRSADLFQSNWKGHSSDPPSRCI